MKYTGSRSHAEPPETITSEALAEGMKGLDPILKLRPCVAEQCVLACPYARHQESEIEAP